MTAPDQTTPARLPGSGTTPPATVPPAPRRRRLRRWLIGLALLVAAVPILAVGALYALVASDALRPRLTAAVEAATGRALTLSGPVRISPSLIPTIALDGVALANPPGFSRPDFLRARRIEAEVALLPLLHREVRVRRLHLVAPDVLLETLPDGTLNWRLGPAARPESVAPPPATAPAAPPRPLTLAVESVTVEEGRLARRTPAGEEALDLPRLTLRAPDPEAPAHIEARLTARGVTATLNATTGPLIHLLRPDGIPWPLRAALSAEGLNVEADGTLDLPFRPEAWRGRLAATADSAARLVPFLPGVALPPARNLSLVAEGEGSATLRSLHLSMGEWTLPLAGRPAVIGPATLTAPAPDTSITGTGTLRWGDLPLAATLEGPSLTALRTPGPRPLALTLEGEGLSLQARGRLGETGWPGTEIEATFRTPDLNTTGTRLGRPGLPALHDATLTATLQARPDGADIPRLALASREAAASGSGAWTTAPGALPRITARLAVERLDADALAPPPPPAPAAAPATLPAPAPAPAPAAPAPPARLIPDRPLDLAALRTAPVAVQAEVAVTLLRALGRDWRDLSGTLALSAGRLSADPLAVTAPGGRLAGAFAADANAAPRLSLALRGADGPLDLGPLLEALGLPAAVTGRATLDLNLTGEGATTRALAGSLNGQAALSLTEGRMDPRLVAGLTRALRGMVPDNALANAALLRCLDLRLAFENGTGRVGALGLETGVLTATGAGTINLRDETLALRLNPLVRIGGVAVTVPVRVDGPLAAPGVRMDAGGAAPGPPPDGGDRAPGCGTPPRANGGEPNVGNLLRGLLGR